MSTQQIDFSWPVLKKWVTSKPDKEYKAISPSSLGGCMRAHYLKIKGVKATTPPTPAALVNFEVGRHWEEVLAKAYEAEDRLVKWFQDGVDEPFYDEETGLGGTPDILVDKDNLTVVDAKTVNSMWFRYGKKKAWSQWVAENQHYIDQQIAYIILARSNGYDVRRAILSFASKDDGYIGLEIEITPSDDEIQAVKARAKLLKRHLEANTLPDCECEGWKIGYCSYGNPNTQQPNSKKKLVNTECCADEATLEKWRQ